MTDSSLRAQTDMDEKLFQAEGAPTNTGHLECIESKGSGTFEKCEAVDDTLFPSDKDTVTRKTWVVVTVRPQSPL